MQIYYMSSVMLFIYNVLPKGDNSKNKNNQVLPCILCMLILSHFQFGSSLPPVVCRTHFLFTLFLHIVVFTLFLHIVVFTLFLHIVVFTLFLHIVVSIMLCFCLVFLCLLNPMLPFSLDCRFLIAPLVFSIVYFRHHAKPTGPEFGLKGLTRLFVHLWIECNLAVLLACKGSSFRMNRGSTSYENSASMNVFKTTENCIQYKWQFWF